MKTILFSLLFGLALCVGAQAQSESRYFVQLQNGQMVYADKLKFKSPLFKQDHFLLNDSLKFSISSVVAYQNADGYYARIAYGNRSDSFAKRILEGPRISKFFTTTYDYYNSGFSPYGYGYGYGGFGMGGGPSRRRIYFFSKDGGALMPFDYESLSEALSDNASSMLLLKRYKQDKLIHTGISILGAGILAYGVINSINNTNEYGQTRLNPTIYAGAAIIAVPFAIQLFQKDKLTQAVEVYNYQIKQ
ncbi:hypothetical protein [Pontibacter sp. SGAir0037]|uniref:hypothetical protein n=1 Tax=Pontibacter sp. SGAir0037 TaxID=2571030 RepID=UPI0010CCC2E1|nr:hypothetical protein [Pontibacter sp. SGAir0037]QCR23931.1 hypothetical protein C1N53_17290 [Pontibacter sp. SGAir0037]